MFGMTILASGITYSLRSEILLGCGDAADQIFLFGFAFGADGEGVQEIQPKREIQRFVLAVAHGTLAQNFHTDNALPFSAHFLDYANDGVWIGIHERADGIDAD